MNIWRIRADYSQEFRELETYSPIWDLEDYYTDDTVTHEVSTVTVTNLKFNYSKRSLHLPKPSFEKSAFPPACRVDTYEKFSSLIDKQVKTFSITIDDCQYICFRPIRFLDLVDLSKSSFDTFSDGEPYNFRKIALRAPPFEGTHVFGLMAPQVLRYEIFVSDRFREIYENSNQTGFSFHRAYPIP